MSTQNQTVRAGIIGSGFAARFHAEALRKVYGVQVEIVGAYSPTRENCEKFCELFGLVPFDDLDSLIGASDVIHVCTPPSTHEEISTMVLERDKYVIIEKPFTGYFGDGSTDFSGERFDRKTGLAAARQSVENLLAAEKASSGRICYAENWVYAPGIQKEREICF